MMPRSFNQKVILLGETNKRSMIIGEKIAESRAKKSAKAGAYESHPPVAKRNILCLNKESLGVLTFEQEHGKFTTFTETDRQWLIDLCKIMVRHSPGYENNLFSIINILKDCASPLIPDCRSTIYNPYNAGKLGVKLRLTRLFSDGHDVVVIDRYEITMRSVQTSRRPEPVIYFTFNDHNPARLPL